MSPYPDGFIFACELTADIKVSICSGKVDTSNAVFFTNI